jgi:hypothetical protein
MSFAVLDTATLLLRPCFAEAAQGFEEQVAQDDCLMPITITITITNDYRSTEHEDK